MDDKWVWGKRKEADIKTHGSVLLAKVYQSHLYSDPCIHFLYRYVLHLPVVCQFQFTLSKE
jgi:spore cortex formation protein SpoVR/YcgB (stage V sporulation)